MYAVSGGFLPLLVILGTEMGKKRAINRSLFDSEGHGESTNVPVITFNIILKM